MDKSWFLNFTFPVVGDVWWMDTYGAQRGGGTRKHEGQDIFAPEGSLVLSVMDGTVFSITTVNSPTPIGGHWLKIRHANGLESYYAHLQNAPSVRVGQHVKSGQAVGHVGNTGNAKNTKPHLHFSMKKNGVHFNPADILLDSQKKKRVAL